MKRIAFFVEGLTERLFLEKLLKNIFSSKDIALEIGKIKGGSKVPISITILKTPLLTADIKFYILIYDCGGDTNVRSYVEEQRQSLINKGYEKIIGIRDVFPFSHADIHKLLNGLNFRLAQKPIPIVFILAIMEVEAWFLAEHTHFQKINARLTPEVIKHNLGFDPATDDMELRNNPANDLNACYNLVGESYIKTEASLERTTNVLDYGEMYFNTFNRVPGLKSLIEQINQLFSN